MNAITSTNGALSLVRDYVESYRIAEGQDAEPHEAGICGAPTCREPKCIAYRHAMKVAS